ncbi:cytochrome c class I [Gluconacetobacter sacchari DSM 12717]|uniref:Cytochrome c n=2 Tax=Gluconacetobacter sacchari TaxID=92759 RepID=A0A7W4NPU9_9PROT|nr:cytochrome c [Gluconacetobacter sacchari]MBB2159388.1 cytochrome c [Gluconacetobacter sacchari]GBQ20537.1 cytochrome c class I [Gluconacetobacter sacchari DSM 12717]
MKYSAGIFCLAFTLLASSAYCADTGKDLFLNNCAACHQSNGNGQAGLAPPLTNKRLWQGMGDGRTQYIAGVALTGLVGKIVSAGEIYADLAMPPQNHLTDDELALVANYIFNDLNGIDTHAAGEDFARTRAAPPSHAKIMMMRDAALK